MKAKNISYPYPVLGNEDDVGGSFDIAFKHVLGRDEIKLKVVFSLKNKTLEKLIKHKKVAFITELECRSTFFRANFSTFEKQAEFSIKSPAVREHVGVAFYIRALESISEYQIDGCHQDYKGFLFEIGPGDILAVGGYTSFVAEKDFDPMRPSVSSFMAIKRGESEKGPLEIDYSENEKIIIKLSKSDWDNYVQIKGKKGIAGILHSSIVLPVLADAVKFVQAGDRELQETHWFKRLEVILRQQELSDCEALKAAQKILRNPVERGLADLLAIREDE
jgi:hypothetical protein